MYPELFRIGTFPITTYGIFLALGMLLALFVASRLAGRDGLSRDRIYDLGLWTLVGGLVGSKILMILVEPDVQIFTLDFLRSGGVFYGGLIGGFLAVAILVPLYKLPFWKVADAFAPGLALGQAFGRQGCFSAGCCWGKATTLPWGVHFTELGHEYTGVHGRRLTGRPMTQSIAAPVRARSVGVGLRRCPSQKPDCRPLARPTPGGRPSSTWRALSKSVISKSIES